MIVFLNLKKSKPKQESWRFVISYYHDDEKEYIEKIKGVEKLKYGKYHRHTKANIRRLLTVD